MPNLLQRFLARPAEQRGMTWPFPPETLNYSGRVYPLFGNQTLIGPKEEVANDFMGLVGGG
jgi:hypothetical protein